MKKVTLLLGILSIMVFISCKKKEETPQPTETTVEVNAPAAVEEKNTDGTSISVGTDGVDVSTKDGTTETNVKVGDGDAKVEIKK